MADPVSGVLTAVYYWARWAFGGGSRARHNIGTADAYLSTLPRWSPPSGVARAAQQTQQTDTGPRWDVNIPAVWRSGESRRGRARRKKVDPATRAIVRGPNGVWEEKAQAARRAPPPTAQRRSIIRATRAGGLGRVVSRGAVADAGNQLAWIWGDIFGQWVLDRTGWNKPIPRGTNRRGASATRPFQPSAIPGRRGGDPSARPSGPASPGRPVTTPAGNPAPVSEPRPAPAGSPGRAPVPSRAPAPAPRPMPGQTPSASLLRLPNLAENLLMQLSPRASPRASARAAQVVSPRPTYPTQYGQGASPILSQAQGLTPSNSPLLGFSTLTQQQPVPQEELDRCKCPKKRKRKSDEKRCTNPVISRTTRHGIRTTKVRLTCPQSRTSKRSPRIPQFPTL